MTLRAEVAAVLGQPVQQRALGEHVDAQAREVALGLAGLLLPLGDRVVLVEGEDAEAVRLADGHALDRDGHVRALAPVLLHERPVVHLVDVIAGQDEHDVARRLLDRLDVLEHGVGGAPVPLRGAVARDERLHHADAAGGPVEVPRAARRRCGR